MEFVALILLIIIIAPKVFPIIIAALGLVVLVIAPIKVLANSILILFKAPRSLFKIAVDRRLRINHALEHATMNVLEQKYKASGLAGLAFKDGFHIYGYEMPAPEIIYRAAREGLERMKEGEKKLAVHTRCGTSVLITQVVISFLYLIVFLWRFKLPPPYFLLGLMVINFLCRPLGALAQRVLTTDTSVNKITITGVTVEEKAGKPVLSVFSPTSVVVHTARDQFDLQS